MKDIKNMKCFTSKTQSKSSQKYKIALDGTKVCYMLELKNKLEEGGIQCRHIGTE